MLRVDALAIYAALVGTGSLAWHVYTWRHGHRVAVTAALEHQADLVFWSESGSVHTYRLTLVVTNRGQVPVYVDTVALRLIDSDEPFEEDQPGEEVRAGHRGRWQFGIDSRELEGKQFVGFARLGTGEVVETPPDALRADVLAKARDRSP
jgi:hypothetical protein